MAYRAMTFRINCPMRHENGNCLVCGGFCTSVSDPICEALHRAYECGYQKGLYGVSGIDIALKGIKILNEAPAADVIEVSKAAEMLYYITGDSCACNFANVNEWLPRRCEISSECPDPGGKYDCWKQFVEHYR